MPLMVPKSVAKVKALSEAIVEDFIQQKSQSDRDRLVILRQVLRPHIYVKSTQKFRSSDWNQLLNQLFCIKPILKS